MKDHLERTFQDCFVCILIIFNWSIMRPVCMHANLNLHVLKSSGHFHFRTWTSSFKGERRFRILDDGRLLEETVEQPPVTFLTPTLISKEEIEVPVTPENAFTETDFQDLFQALDLPDIINFEPWNQSRKNWNSFVPS